MCELNAPSLVNCSESFVENKLNEVESNMDYRGEDREDKVGELRGDIGATR
jgi:hypothetical protein